MKPLQRLTGYFRPYKNRLMLGILCILFTNLIKLTGPFVLRRAVDELSMYVSSGILLRYAGLIVFIACAQGATLFLQRRILINMSRDIEYDIRNDFYSHLQKMPLDFFHRNRTGDLMARATNDLSAVRMVVGPALMYSANAIFATSLILPIMLSINWRLTLLAFVTMPLVAAPTQYFSRRIHDRFEKVQEYFGTMSNRAQESLAGIRVVKAYVQEDSEERSFRQVNRELVNRNMKLIKLSAAFYPILQLFIGFGFIAILWYGGRLTIDKTISIGQFVQFTVYLGFLVWPMIALGWVFNLFQRGKASMGRIEAILSSSPSITDDPVVKEDAVIKGEIEFRNLTLRHENASEPALEGINLLVELGRTVAFVGSVGSGKSTLINLVPRLLDAPPGMVLIDNKPIQQIPLSILRGSIGYVPQETFLFGESIADNIAFGVVDSTREEIENAAIEAGLADDIAQFPEGYDTVVGERGITLSGGQKQRCALARALIRRPKILILDDALSSVDTFTEEKILRHLRQIMRGRTSLIVSHRVSTIKDADLIVVLERGRIVERGTHEELLEIGGIYAELYEKQLLEEELSVT